MINNINIISQKIKLAVFFKDFCIAFKDPLLGI